MSSRTRTHASSSKHDLQQALDVSSERYALLSRATNDAIYDLSIASGTMTWNEALATAYGHSLAEAGDTLEWWIAHIHPEDAMDVEASLSELLQSKATTWQTDYRFRRKDGSYAHVRNRAYVQRAADGTPQRIIGSLLDLTADYQLDRAKDEFISLVSHQLRTPLTIMRLLSEMLASNRAGNLNPQQKEYAEHISAASVRMIGLVSDILDISRIELGRVSVTPEPSDPAKIIRRIVRGCRRLAKEKQPAINNDDVVSPSRPVPLDPLVFSELVHILLTNAIRYTHPGTGLIRLTFRADDEGFLLTVRDNGIGIPTHARTHIFTRFYRADNATNFVSGGNGLGLYLAKLITELFHGRIWFESTPGKGSTFFVRIPPSGMPARKGSATLHGPNA